MTPIIFYFIFLYFQFFFTLFHVTIYFLLLTHYVGTHLSFPNFWHSITVDEYLFHYGWVLGPPTYRTYHRVFLLVPIPFLLG